MSNTVITNYTDLNGPSTKADSSVVVIVNKDGSLSVDQNLLGTLMGTDGSQSAGISVVRVGHEGKPDDATDSESEDDKIPHVTLTVDSYYNEPNSIIKYDSGAEMLQSLRIETRENSLIGFHNDHCYTALTSPSQVLPQSSESFTHYDDPVIEISHTPPPKPVPSSKKITILEQQIIPKGKKIHINATEPPIILKGNDVLNKPLPVKSKAKENKEASKIKTQNQVEESTDSSSISSSGDSIPDRDSDSDYKERKDTSSSKQKKSKAKAKSTKIIPSKPTRPELKLVSKAKTPKAAVKKELKEVKTLKPVETKPQIEEKDGEVDLESLLPSSKINTTRSSTIEFNKTVVKQSPKPVKKEKKTPAHVTALLSDMTSLFSTPDVIRRVSTDGKATGKQEPSDKKTPAGPKPLEICEGKIVDPTKIEVPEKSKQIPKPALVAKKDNAKLLNPTDKAKGYDLIPQLDDASLAQILQDTTGISNPIKNPAVTTAAMNSPGLAGPLSPTLDLLGGLQPEEEGLTEDLLMHVAQLVESSENLQEVIDKQVLGKVDTVGLKAPPQTQYQPAQTPQQLYSQQQLAAKTTPKTVVPRKEPIEIVRRDGRVITLPPIEAPATRSSKRKSQIENTNQSNEVMSPLPSTSAQPIVTTPEPVLTPSSSSKHYINKRLISKQQEPPQPADSAVTPVEKSAESQESWNSEDDPYRLWCICKQPHNNRFMICCDGCEDWFHGKCVNITKAMGQQMEEQGIEWRCPNCVKKAKGTPPKPAFKTLAGQKKHEPPELSPEGKTPKEIPSKTGCIVCKKAARASSIYCSNACILKHAQDSLGQAKHDAESEKSNERRPITQDSTVIVYERRSGKLLAGANAPTAGNLKAWLQKNPTFEVVRPGTLSTIKPGLVKKKSSGDSKVQTTLNFERIPRKPAADLNQIVSPKVQEEKRKVPPSPRQEIKTPTAKIQVPKTPTSKSHGIQIIDTPKPSTSTARSIPEPRKIARQSSRHQSTDKPSASPSTPRRKDSGAGQADKNKMNSEEDIRDNVRKSLQEQICLRVGEMENAKFTVDEIQEFANETEMELHDLFKDTGMKYKAKYRSLMFNIKDRKNLTLWQKICNKSITPKQLVRLSPEELASQELAEWRDQEAKHQLELIKKSELDLLAASKTYVLKTHKGEQVMETKEAVSTELDPNVPVEDVVVVLNDSIGGEENPKEIGVDGKTKPNEKKESSNKKRGRDEANSSRSKKSKRDSRRESDRKHSSRRKSASRERDSKDERRRSSRRHSEKKSRTRSPSRSRERSKRDSKEKSGSVERSRHRSRSRDKSGRKSKSRERSRSVSERHGRLRRRSRTRDTTTHRSPSKNTADEHKHRSKSQDTFTKNKTDSTDSDSVERPKSAMLKDQHPEYDPHEPMITSAISEEDLRKSEDAYEDNYKSEVIDAGAEYDPVKSFTLDTLGETFTTKIDKAAEAESDQEPSSTVENAAATIWNGCINMVDVARFYVSAHEVSGSAVDLEEDLVTELDIVGRINPETVWDYISKTKKTSNKDIVILKLQAANDEEKMQYIALYSYLSSRSRLGVVKTPSTASIKDFYIVPLPANTGLPPVLLPLDGPGLGDVKTHLLIAVIIRQRRKRHAPHAPKEVVPAKVVKVSRKRSYTPPTSPRRRQLPMPSYPGSALSTSVKDKIAASLACADDEEAYSPGSSNSSNSAPAPAVILPPGATGAGGGGSLRNKMEELNRQIEEQKLQILKMAQADSSVGAEDEAYSPSRPMTPPPVVPPALADISLPSNLQEILATIKKRSEKTTDIDMRTMPPLP